MRCVVTAGLIVSMGSGECKNWSDWAEWRSVVSLMVSFIMSNRFEGCEKWCGWTECW